MLNNVYLFTGEESLLLQQEVKRWENAFAKKHGANSVFVFNGENFDNNQAIQSVFGSGFFSSATLTIFKDIPTPANANSSKYEIFTQEFVKRKGQVAQESFVVFASTNPDKRGKLYKFLKKEATIKEFKKLRKNEIKKLISATLSPIHITDGGTELFIEKVGSDLQRILYETDKLIHRSKANNIQEIGEKNIEDITHTFTKQDAFKFFGIIFKNNKTAALNFIDSMQDESGNWYQFLGSVYWTLNLYLILLDFFDQGKDSYESIKNEYKINPFVLKINLGQKDKILRHRAEIKNMYLGLVELDDKIKSGKKTPDEFRIQLKKLIYPFITK